jgi:gamma-glutamyltranspeptidase/glutathione hydrolase
MKGVVVCPQPRAADVGAEILENGGTAFDAALAAAFAQMICDPFMCGLGGMGTLQYFKAETGESGMIDFQAVPRSPAIRCSTISAPNSAIPRL